MLAGRLVRTKELEVLFRSLGGQRPHAHAVVLAEGLVDLSENDLLKLVIVVRPREASPIGRGRPNSLQAAWDMSDGGERRPLRSAPSPS
jgi:hypothetical protein